MGIKKLIFKILPLHTFISLRKKYRTVLRKIYAPISEKEFKDILSNQLEIKKGSVVFIHSSIDALNISFPAYKLFEMLLDAVGQEGTLLFPAWHFTYRAEDYLKKDLIFDVEQSPSMLGMLSEIARRHPDAKRSIHPTTSIVAIGKYADEMIAEHGDSIYPCDEKSPYYKIMQYDGIIIGLGVNNNFLAFVHCPEDVLKEKFPVKTRLDKIFGSKVKLSNGTIRIVKTLAAHPQIRNNNIPLFMHKHVDKTICKNITIRGNRFFVAHSRELFDEIIRLARKNITIYTSEASIKN